jgi:trigger factor
LIEELAQLQIKKELAVGLVAEKEGLQVTDKEYKKLAEEFAKEQGFKTIEECEEAYGKDGLRQMFLDEKVSEYLMKDCKFVEPKEKK